MESNNERKIDFSNVDVKGLNDRLKPFIIYWLAIAILIITMFMMIKDFNRYEFELHDYYRNLMVENNCLPTSYHDSPLGYVIATNYTCNDPQFSNGYWYCDLDNLSKI